MSRKKELKALAEMEITAEVNGVFYECTELGKAIEIIEKAQQRGYTDDKVKNVSVMQAGKLIYFCNMEILRNWLTDK